MTKIYMCKAFHLEEYCATEEIEAESAREAMAIWQELSQTATFTAYCHEEGIFEYQVYDPDNDIDATIFEFDRENSICDLRDEVQHWKKELDALVAKTETFRGVAGIIWGLFQHKLNLLNNWVESRLDDVL